jgi:hypothetical protein
MDQRQKIRAPSNGNGKDARFVPFDSPFVLRFSKDERRLRAGFGYVVDLKILGVTPLP